MPETPDFRAIADYGLLADCNSAALVDRFGSVDWLCLPRYDSAAVLSRILDPAAGHWSICPVQEFTAERRYLPGTLVIETTFTTETGRVRLTDAMAFCDGQRAHDLGYDAPHELLRQAEGVEGRVELRLELAPRPEFGLYRPLVRRLDDGARSFGGDSPLRLRSGVALDVDEDSTVRGPFTLVAGSGGVGFALRWLPVEAQEAPEPTAPGDVPARIEDTVAAWRSWEDEHDVYEGAHRDRVRLSARVLKGLTYRPTGAIVAAPTSSLPETVGGERNWDYRFSWIRDSSLTLEALYIGACSDEAEEFVSFMTSSAGGRAGGGSLQIMYGIRGEHDLSERELSHLRGWRDSAPVRVGNGAWNQIQLDVYGELLNALWLYRERLGTLHRRFRPLRRTWPTPPPRAGMSATRACGRCAASLVTTSPPRSCVGRRSTAPCCWPRTWASTRRPKSGPPRARRSGPRCSNEAGRRRAGPTPSPSTPTSSTPRRC